MLKCECGGLRKVVRHLTDREKIKEELKKRGLWKEPACAATARRPAQEELFDELPQTDGVDPPAPDDAA